jgi:hypothetical protein
MRATVAADQGGGGGNRTSVPAVPGQPALESGVRPLRPGTAGGVLVEAPWGGSSVFVIGPRAQPKTPATPSKEHG